MSKYIVIGGFIGAGICLIFSLMGFLGKDMILSNTYIKAPKEKQAQMDKKPFRLQGAVIFLFLGVVALLNSLRLTLGAFWLHYVTVAIFFIGIIYTVVSENALKKKYI